MNYSFFLSNHTNSSFSDILNGSAFPLERKYTSASFTSFFINLSKSFTLYLYNAMVFSGLVGTQAHSMIERQFSSHWLSANSTCCFSVNFVTAFMISPRVCSSRIQLVVLRLRPRHQMYCNNRASGCHTYSRTTNDSTFLT